TLWVVTGEDLLQCADGAAADPVVLRAFARLRTSARARHDPTGFDRTGTRSNLESGADDFRSGIRRGDSAQAHRRSDPVPIARPDLLDLRRIKLLVAFAFQAQLAAKHAVDEHEVSQRQNHSDTPPDDAYDQSMTSGGGGVDGEALCGVNA